jgi:pimeloyl-ACP methyl ester carboxylesterase
LLTRSHFRHNRSYGHLPPHAVGSRPGWGHFSASPAINWQRRGCNAFHQPFDGRNVGESRHLCIRPSLDPDSRAINAAVEMAAELDFFRPGQVDQDLSVYISIRTIGICSSDEPAGRKAVFKKALNALGEGSRVVMIDGAGHWPHLEAPQICLEELLDFLASKA